MRKKVFQTGEETVEIGKKADRGRIQKEVRWDRLDNTAHLFPVIAGEQMSNVYRVSVTLKEPVVPEFLQQALNIVLPRFDGFNLRLRRGVFWYYFEENNKPAPEVQKENRFPCRFIRPNENHSYLFRVSYYKYRINVEIFHVLTDGMGAINFLKELMYQYLRILHPELVEKTGDSLSCGTTLNREDSFLKNYKKISKKMYKTQKACLIKGERLREGEFGVMHGYMNVAELKKVSKEWGATINEYLVAVYIWSVYHEYLHGCPSKRPVRVAVPVNLRPYFHSITTKNFFVMVSAEFHPTKEGHTFQEVMEGVKESLRSQLTSEHLEQIFSYNVSNQKNRLLKAVPLPFKNIAMRYVYTQSALANTATITNIGKIDIAEEYKPYIEMFHVFMAISKGQHIKGSICSYDDTLVFTFSYDLVDPFIQRGFFRKLVQDGIQIEIESNGVHYE